MPMYTLTTRKSSPDRLELRYAETTSQITLSETPLSPFLNKWVEVTEKSIILLQVIIPSQLSTWIRKMNCFIMTILRLMVQSNWRPGGEFMRPKWGICKFSLFEDLRDEEVLFSYFSVEE